MSWFDRWGFSLTSFWNFNRSKCCQSRCFEFSWCGCYGFSWVRYWDLVGEGIGTLMEVVVGSIINPYVSTLVCQGFGDLVSAGLQGFTIRDILQIKFHTPPPKKKKKRFFFVCVGWGHIFLNKFISICFIKIEKFREEFCNSGQTTKIFGWKKPKLTTKFEIKNWKILKNRLKWKSFKSIFAWWVWHFYWCYYDKKLRKPSYHIFDHLKFWFNKMKNDKKIQTRKFKNLKKSNLFQTFECLR